MLNTSYTATSATLPGDTVYGNQVHLDGLGVEYKAPSPSGDLNGRPRLLISHTASKSGIVRTLLSLQTPQYVGDPAVEKGFTKVDLVLNRDAGLPQVNLKVEIEKIADLLSETTIVDALISAGV